MDFEQAAINASRREYPDATTKGCLFHLGQSLWHHIQAASLSKKYGDNEEFSLKLRHIFALALLLASDIPTAVDELNFSCLLTRNQNGSWIRNQNKCYKIC